MNKSDAEQMQKGFDLITKTCMALLKRIEALEKAVVKHEKKFTDLQEIKDKQDKVNQDVVDTFKKLLGFIDAQTHIDPPVIKKPKKESQK
jgi:vacuolar-type H+-ATPase subunit I/STV1